MLSVSDHTTASKGAPVSMLTREDDVDAHALHRRGWTVSAIARHLGHDRKTIRAYLSGERSAGVRQPAGHDPFDRFDGVRPEARRHFVDPAGGDDCRTRSGRCQRGKHCLAGTALAFTGHLSDAERAIVDVWSVLVVGVAGMGAPRQLWRTVTVDLVWERDDWRIDGWATVPGPTPALAPIAAVSGVAAVAVVLSWDDALSSGSAD